MNKDDIINQRFLGNSAWLSILEDSLAKGEIDHDEYEKIMEMEQPHKNGRFVVGGPKRRNVAKVPIRDGDNKIIGYKNSERDIQTHTGIDRKTGKFFTYTEPTTGKYGDKNYAQFIPSFVITKGRPGRRKDKKAKKIDPKNICHRVLSAPGAENARYDRLNKMKVLRELSNLAKAYIGRTGSDKGMGNDPVIGPKIAECHVLECDKGLIRLAKRGGNISRS